MLAFTAPSVFQASKCYFTYGTMGHLDPQQLPSSKKPWTAVNSLDFIHKVSLPTRQRAPRPRSSFTEYSAQMELLLPQEYGQVAKQKLVEGRKALCFQRVILPLGELLTGDFFKEYIKIGESRRGSANHIRTDAHGGPKAMFSCSPKAVLARITSSGSRMVRQGGVLRSSDRGHRRTDMDTGNLTMFLDRETYERAGLVGKPHGVKGKRGTKPRWGMLVHLEPPYAL